MDAAILPSTPARASANRRLFYIWNMKQTSPQRRLESQITDPKCPHDPVARLKRLGRKGWGIHVRLAASY
jgi:hypothetical protein